MGSITIEKRGAVVIAHFPEHPTADIVHDFFDQMVVLFEQAPLAIVLDALAVKSAPISVRDAAGRRLKVMAPLLKKSCRGQATVLDSAFVRGALATVHFFSPPKYPAQTFSDLQSAISWAEVQVQVSASGEFRLI